MNRWMQASAWLLATVMFLGVASTARADSDKKSKSPSSRQPGISKPQGSQPIPFFPATGKTKGNNGVGNGIDPQPPGNPPVNDGPGTRPGFPGNRGGVNGMGKK